MLLYLALLAQSLPEFYEAYSIRDDSGRPIHYYLTKAETAQPTPLVLWIQGSGAYSHFLNRGGRAVETVAALRAQLKGKARLLLVEKPGVEFLSETRPLGTTANAPEAFRRDFSLERWTDALSAPLQDALSQPGVDRSRLLVAGHSEGALLACEVAARHPNQVTNVAPLSAGGMTQLYSLIELARAKSDAEVTKILEGWREVQRDPTSYEKSWFGHTYLRWSSFLRSSCAKRLDAAPTASVYLAHGTKDTASAIQSTDALYATLLATNRKVVYERLEGADHGLQFSAEPQRNGLAEVFGRIILWYAPN